jgi:cytochrome c peroxidase
MSSTRLPAAVAALVLLALAAGFEAPADATGHGRPGNHDQISNRRTFRNPAGRAGTFSTQGSIDLTSEFFQPQGTNGRSCASCHLPQDAWSINPGTLQELFDDSGGLHPVFNALDANNPAMDLSTVDARLEAYSMMLSRGVFRRGGAPKANAEWELVAADDPHKFANLTRLVHWRRSMPTMNFAVGSATVHWDGGPAKLSARQKAQGRLDLFDAWIGHRIPRLAQIARGQELFNDQNVGGGRCGACHNSANNGTNISDRFFDIGVASADVRTPDLPLYTFRNRTTGEERQLTDAGRGNVTGLWSDLGRFKTPTLRALAARAPYFHNGMAETLEDVVRHYETQLGFVFTKRERADLVAFLKAL